MVNDGVWIVITAMGHVNLREVMSRYLLFGFACKTLFFSYHLVDLERIESHWLSLQETSCKTVCSCLFIHSFIYFYICITMCFVFRLPLMGFRQKTNGNCFSIFGSDGFPI